MTSDLFKWNSMTADLKAAKAKTAPKKQKFSEVRIIDIQIKTSKMSTKTLIKFYLTGNKNVI